MTATCSGLRAIAERPPAALPGPATEKAPFQFPPAHQFVPTDPSGATQKTSICSGFLQHTPRLVGIALPAGAIGNGRVQPTVDASHIELITEPSGATQKSASVPGLREIA